MPGQTTVTDAISILSQSPIVSTAEVITVPLQPPEIGILGWNWVGNGEDGGAAYFDPQSSSRTIYRISPDLPAIKFEDVIQAYGEPSHIVAKSFQGPDIGSGTFYDLNIMYLSHGILLASVEGNKPSLTSDTEFGAVTFFFPDEKGLEAAYGGGDLYLPWIAAWQGMKDFDFYCRDEAGRPCR